jgi:hypothetical protein
VKRMGCVRLWAAWLMLGGAVAVAQMPKPAVVFGPVHGRGPSGPSGPGPVSGGNPVVPAAARVVLQGLAARAGVIFAGHVLEVTRTDGAGYVDVVFAVDRAVLGCAGSKRYVLREWAGLWAEAPERYGVGERLLMILAARGPSGMSAPVGGMAGRIPLVGLRQGPVMRGGVVPTDSAAEDGVEEAVDLRWVEAASARSAASGAKARSEVAKAGGGWLGPVTPAALSSVAPPTLSAVLAVLDAE